MGVYDQYKDGRRIAQVKVNATGKTFQVGEIVPIPDGIYVTFEGFVIVEDQVFISLLELYQIHDKWGDPMEFAISDRNPVVKALSEFKEIKYRMKDKDGLKKKDSP